jgi:hypothetical protein
MNARTFVGGCRQRLRERLLRRTAERPHRWHAAVAGALLALGCGAVSAHKASDAYLTIDARAEPPLLRIDVALRDLDRELDLDSDGDGTLAWGEVRGRWGEIARLVGGAVEVRRGDAACPPGPARAPALEQHTDGSYAVLQLPLGCAAGTQGLSIAYRLFEASDPLHRGLLRVRRGAGAGGGTEATPAQASDVTVLTASPHWQRLASAGHAVVGDAQRRDSAGDLRRFAAEGLHHIASGLDHILFLTTLVLVVVFRREGGRWVARERGVTAFGEALRVVTAFTVAHSITLALAVTGIASPPSRGVETVIAASVLIAAIDNLWPLLPWPRWTMAGLFGLAHGFGFAGPLQSLGLAGTELVVPLLGFNLGVEAGQLLIVGLLLPLLVAWRARRLYQRAVVPWASAAIASLATVWIVERALDLQLGI